MNIQNWPEAWPDLVGRIYDCAIDASTWPAVLEEIQDQMACHQSFLRVDDLVGRRTSIATSVGVKPEWQQRHGALAAEVMDILVGVLSSGHSIDLPTVASHVMTTEQLRQTRYATEWGNPRGFVDYMGLFLLVSPSRLAALELARHESKGLFEAHVIDRARQLIPHLRRSMTICNALDAATLAHERLADTLDALSLGVVLADADSHILHANCAAETMMKKGTFLRAKSNRLQAGDGRAANEVRTAIDLAARNETRLGNTGLAVRLTDETSDPVVAHVLPLGNGEKRQRLDTRAVAAVFVNPGRDDAARTRAMSRAYRLTAAEARVLERMLCAQTVSEAAAHLGIATSTAKTHLNAIFAKTGTQRRADLILLAAKIAPLGQ